MSTYEPGELTLYPGWLVAWLLRVLAGLAVGVVVVRQVLR